MDNQDLAYRLKRLREANGYSLRDLAEKIGSSANTIMRWERNESTPSQDFVVKLAEIYGRDPVWMLFGLKKSNSKKRGDTKIETITTRLELLTEDQLHAVHSVVALFLELEVEEPENGRAKVAEE